MTFTPSDVQAKAISGIKRWFSSAKSGRGASAYRVFGYAGTGKTTIVETTIQELGLKGKTAFAAFTGKAAMVMTRKGTPAQTIHSLIYKMDPEVMDYIARLEMDLETARMKRAPTDAIEDKLREAISAPKFILKDSDDESLSRISLIVIDEVSMVDEKMATDLLSFRIPILVLGDPGQLPPTDGEGYFTQSAPDVMLTEVHRQASESAIHRLAMIARSGKFIPYGQHDEFVYKMKHGSLSPQQMSRSGAVICAYNKTRRYLNNNIRFSLGFTERYPTGNGERLVTVKNIKDIGIINGMYVGLSGVKETKKGGMMATVVSDIGDVIGGVTEKGTPSVFPIYKGHFDDHICFEADRNYRDFRIKQSHVQCDWGYAITAHKSQGSQYENVIVIDEKFGKSRDDYQRWLYTAITRAERGLVILG